MCIYINIKPFINELVTIIQFNIFLTKKRTTMKKIAISFLAVFFAISAAFSQDNGIHANRSLKANFDDYKSFYWSSDIQNIIPDHLHIGLSDVIIFNNESERSKVQDAIEHELQAKGLKQDPNNPDLVVNFRILEKDADLRAYNGYETTYYDFEKVRTENNVETIHLKKGSLLISLADREKGQVVWQGYSSGTFNGESIKDNQQIKMAVEKIFDHYASDVIGASSK